jgi:hypothetical protein
MLRVKNFAAVISFQVHNKLIIVMSTSESTTINNAATQGLIAYRLIQTLSVGYAFQTLQ